MYFSSFAEYAYLKKKKKKVIREELVAQHTALSSVTV